MTFILLHFQSFLTDRGRCCGIGQRDNINSSKQNKQNNDFSGGKKYVQYITHFEPALEVAEPQADLGIAGQRFYGS